jgi:transposase, IS30 family
MKEYKRLTQEQRYQIFAYLEAGMLKAEIATKIGKYQSSIGREIERNSVEGNYDPKRAEELADFRKRNSHKHMKVTEEIKETIIEKLQEDQWSPEEIYGRSKRMGYKMVSHGAIYGFVYQNAKNDGTLHKNLRRGHKKKKTHKETENRGKIINAKSIDDRPEEVSLNINFGHFEGDTIIGKDHKQAIVVLVERKTKTVLAKKIEAKNANLTQQAITELLSPFAPISKTLTVDNGKEFANHEKITSTTGIDVYFSHKGCPGERGLCENTNSLIRQYLPKGSSFENVTDKDIQEIVGKLNMRPRKTLGFASPAEALASILAR